MTNLRRLFINGELTEGRSGRTFDNVNPATGKVIGQVCEAGRDDVDAAVQAARLALTGPWGRMSVADRMNILRAIADRIDARHDEFLAAEIADTGKPRSLAARLDIPRGAANFRIFADAFPAAPTETFHTDTADGQGALNYAVRRPVGVVGVICPWNLPLLLMTWKVAPALAAGNTLVVKPSEETPSSATLLAEVMNEVGVPAGVFNLVHGFGPGSAGELITRHPGVDAITFTGESATGEAIMKVAAEGVRKVSFELGGKNPSLVFADADFDAAVEGTIRSAFSNCGQICLCTERVYVERTIFERFVEALAAGAHQLRLGDPWDDATSMGPLISGNHRDKVTGYFSLAEAEGATVVTGGEPAMLTGDLAGGFWVQPTILTGLPNSARCIQEEIFGPVCHIAPFDSEDEALALANDTQYGLCAAVWTQNLSRAHRLGARLDVGLVWVNTWFLRDLRTPFGGVGLSGIGREGGVHSFEFYSELRNVCVKL